jgi:hypothetical protein
MQVHDGFAVALPARSLRCLTPLKGLLCMVQETVRVIDITRPSLTAVPSFRSTMHFFARVRSVLPIKSHVDGMPSVSFSTSGQHSPHSATCVNFEFLLRKMRPLKTTPELTDYTACRLYSIFGPLFSGSKKALLGMLFSRKSALSRVKPSSNHGTEFRHSRILNTPDRSIGIHLLLNVCKCWSISTS